MQRTPERKAETCQVQQKSQLCMQIQCVHTSLHYLGFTTKRTVKSLPFLNGQFLDFRVTFGLMRSRRCYHFDQLR
jgi:hypothetical protein